MAKGSAGFFVGVGAVWAMAEPDSRRHQEHGAHRLHEHL